MAKDGRLTIREVTQAHRMHVAGWSIRAIARLQYRTWGYASADSAAYQLRAAMKQVGLEIRSQREATADANMRHGHMRSAHWAIDHPNHEAVNAQRRHLRALKKEAA